MLKLHGCKKCHGSLILDKDEFGWYEECIQCGYVRDIPLDIPLITPQEVDPIPVRSTKFEQNLTDLWIQDRIPSFKPIKSMSGVGEDTY